MSTQLKVLREAVQEDIKRHLFTIVIAASANIRKQLNEALGIIAKSDFHAQWPGLLPELVQNLDKPGTQIAVFEAMAAVFQPLREVTIDDCDETMDYCQKGAGAKVLEVVQVPPPSPHHLFPLRYQLVAVPTID